MCKTSALCDPCQCRAPTTAHPVKEGTNAKADQPVQTLVKKEKTFTIRAY